MDATEELPTAVGGGLVLGRYRLGARLGSGGFGTVFAARDERLDRAVAVKAVPAAGPVPERAQREALAAARLDHPGIVAVFDAGVEGNERFLVSELVRGRTLAVLERDGELSDRDVLRVGLSLADALIHAHARGVIHRDVKPQNVIVPDDTAGAAAKLLDFGVAHLAGDEPLTRTGDVVGTLAYMAPEQAAGRRVDARADIYSLALVLYEALVRREPRARAEPGGDRAPRRHPVALAAPAAPRPARGAVRGDRPRAGAGPRAPRHARRPRGGARGRAAGRRRRRRHARAAARGEAKDRGAGAPGGRRGRGRARRRGLDRRARRAEGAVSVPQGDARRRRETCRCWPRRSWWPRPWRCCRGSAGCSPRPAESRSRARPASRRRMLAASPLLLPRAGLAWSVPAAAPLLGLAGLAGAYPAIAGTARRAWTRAALGAAGLWWLLLAEPLLDRDLALGTPAPGDLLDPGALGALLLAPLWARRRAADAVARRRAARWRWTSSARPSGPPRSPPRRRRGGQRGPRGTAWSGGRSAARRRAGVPRCACAEYCERRSMTAHERVSKPLRPTR